MQSTIAERKVAIEVGELSPVWADPDALEQVFANLIGNAVNYLDPNRAGVIAIGCRDSGNGQTTYFIRDNGRGVAPAYWHKIFQVFQRLHPAASSGEGIGLAIVARVVERHRGRVWVESEEGMGSTFSVSLPAATGASVGGEQSETKAPS
jgi:signal transduction histidine kinase